MTNNKQSSVEWIASELSNHLEMPHKYFIEILEQAKAMHKEEIEEAHFAPKYGCFSEQYYNETFGGNND